MNLPTCFWSQTKAVLTQRALKIQDKTYKLRFRSDKIWPTIEWQRQRKCFPQRCKVNALWNRFFFCLPGRSALWSTELSSAGQVCTVWRFYHWQWCSTPSISKFHTFPDLNILTFDCSDHIWHLDICCKSPADSGRAGTSTSGWLM